VNNKQQPADANPEGVELNYPAGLREFLTADLVDEPTEKGPGAVCTPGPIGYPQPQSCG